MDPATMEFHYIAIAWLVLGVLYIVCRLTERRTDAQEPQIVRPIVPYIGHVIGMVAQGGKYTKRIASKYTPIFTLPMPGSRMYIVTDPTLAATVQKTKTLSFNPVIPMVTKRVLGLDDDTVQILKTNIGREDGPGGFFPEVHHLVYSAMTPGPKLDELTDRAAKIFQKHLQNYADALSSPQNPSSTTELLYWTQHLVTIVTAEFLYGPNNPIATNPSRETSFWDFDHGLGSLLAFADFIPSITARKAYRGREAVVTAMRQYLMAGHHKDASPLIQHRICIAQKYGMSLDGIARSELSFLFAGIVNTAITSFWLILHIFSDPDLLATIRTEIKKCTTTNPFPSAPPTSATSTLDPSLLTTLCPTLFSTYRETLRSYSDSSSNRLVTTPTLLANTYQLTKDSILQISGAAMHSDPSIWGDDVAKFDAYRFLPERMKERRVHPAAFRAFGGGSTICPGRHFAGREILYFVGMVAVMFDVDGLDGSEMRIPRKRDDVLPVHILEPKGEVRVRIRLRGKI